MESLASVLDEAIDGHTYHAPTRFLALPKDGKMLGESASRSALTLQSRAHSGFFVFV